MYMNSASGKLATNFPLCKVTMVQVLQAGDAEAFPLWEESSQE